MKYTEGPWEVDETKNGRIYITGPGGRQITPNIDVEDEQDRADYNLMAAAPELYQALEAMAGKAGKQNWNDKYPDQLAAAYAALAKARGE